MFYEFASDLAMKLSWLMARKNLRSDWFGTLCAFVGVALGVATVCAVFVLDENTRTQELNSWKTNPDKPVDFSATLQLSARAFESKPQPLPAGEDPAEEMHEDYQIMRFLIRTGSLTAFLVGALIVFFTFRVVIEQRKREIALLRSLGATRREVARIFLLEALLLGLAGAGAGLLLSFPLTLLCARLGITTTGRAQLSALRFPWGSMLSIAGLGCLSAVLGVVRPLQEVLKQDLPRTLRPQLHAPRAQRPRGFAWLALPLASLFYVLVRPFFRELLPSLAVLVVEALLVCALFVSVLVLTPSVMGVLGRAVLWGPKAVRLLTRRRLERAAHEFSWPVSGVTLVFALLLALHSVVFALTQEILHWGASALDSVVFFHSDDGAPIPEGALEPMPKDLRRLRSSSRTPWPNVLIALNTQDLRSAAEYMDPAAQAIAAKLGPGKVILSTLLARRLGLSVGETLHAKGDVQRAFQVIGIRDDLGYYPIATDSYRNGKTFGVISEEDFALIAPYASAVGSVVSYRSRVRGPLDWPRVLGPLWKRMPHNLFPGSNYKFNRLLNTERDFLIFDFILLLTGFLAAVGIANNLVLAAYVRQRELALFRVLGMSQKQLFTLCLVEGGLIGLIGGLIAIALGVPLGWTAIEALKLVSAFDVDYILVPRHMVIVLVSAMLLAGLASLYPAWVTARSQPQDR